jgi:hypothetical protein
MKMQREFKSKKRYLAAFLIGTGIFLLLFLLSYSVSYFEFQRVSNLQDDLAYKIFEDKLYYSFFDEMICESESLDKISRDLNFQRGIIDEMEKDFGKMNERVLFRKNFYTLIELEHFEFVQTLNEKCNYDFPIMLFFYSNDEEIIEESERVGRLLGAVHEENPNMMIYSFDVDLQNKLIDSLKRKYEVEEPLTVIINDEIKVVNPEHINEILDVLD